MNSLNKTPEDFGLKVMSHPTTLLVTAPNKLRSAKNYSKSISLSEQVIETPRLLNDNKTNKENLRILSNFIDKISEEYGFELFENKNPLFKNVDKERIINFITNFKSHISNLHFQARELAEYINSNKKELNLWDVVLITGSSKLRYTFENFSINPSIRKFLIRDEVIIQISGSKNRLGSATAPRAGLSKEILEEIKEKHKKNNAIRASENKKPLAEKETMYTEYAPDRKPLLMIYLIELLNEDKIDYNKLKIEYDRITYGLGLAFPRMDDYRDKHFIEYKLNKVYYKQMFFDFDQYDLGDEYDD